MARKVLAINATATQTGGTDMSIIKRQTATKAIKSGSARKIGTCVSDGWRWQIVERTDMQRTDHYRIERV